jgi:hypothetical protein
MQLMSSNAALQACYLCQVAYYVAIFNDDNKRNMNTGLTWNERNVDRTSAALSIAVRYLSMHHETGNIRGSSLVDCNSTLLFHCKY